MSNGLLDALKTTKKAANTHTHIHRKCVKRDMECVKRRCWTHTHKLYMYMTDTTDQTVALLDSCMRARPFLQIHLESSNPKLVRTDPARKSKSQPEAEPIRCYEH